MLAEICDFIVSVDSDFCLVPNRGLPQSKHLSEFGKNLPTICTLGKYALLDVIII